MELQRPSSALASLERGSSQPNKAYKLSLHKNSTLSHEISDLYREAKKSKWRIYDQKRRETESEQYQYLKTLISKDCSGYEKN